VANSPACIVTGGAGVYYGCKKLGGIRRERSLSTCDRKIAERRLKEWIGNLDKVDAEVEKTRLGQFIQRYLVVTVGVAHNTHVTNNAIINEFLKWWPLSTCHRSKRH
jgi:hypothetical protein